MFLMAFLFLLSCGACVISRDYTTNPIRIYEVDLGEEFLGTCTFKTPPLFELHYIEMNTELITKAGISSEMILLHELLHCQAGLGHVEPESFIDGCSKTLMQPGFNKYNAGEHCWERHGDFYMSQYQQLLTCRKDNSCGDIPLLWPSSQN